MTDAVAETRSFQILHIVFRQFSKLGSLCSHLLYISTGASINIYYSTTGEHITTEISRQL